jgi:hypothetical protein
MHCSVGKQGSFSPSSLSNVPLAILSINLVSRRSSLILTIILSKVQAAYAISLPMQGASATHSTITYTSGRLILQDLVAKQLIGRPSKYILSLLSVRTSASSGEQSQRCHMYSVTNKQTLVLWPVGHWFQR